MGVACGGTLLHIMPQGHGIGGPWWVETVSWWATTDVVNLSMVVHDINGLVVDCLYRAVWLVCKARLVCHDDEQSDDVCKAWAGGCWPSVWTDASGLMDNYYVCAACGQVVWAIWLDGGWLKHGPNLPKHGLTHHVGCWVMGRTPIMCWDMGCDMCWCAVAVTNNY